MSSFLDSTGLSRLVSKITDYFAKKDGTYPDMTVGNVSNVVPIAKLPTASSVTSNDTTHVPTADAVYKDTVQKVDGYANFYASSDTGYKAIGRFTPPGDNQDVSAVIRVTYTRGSVECCTQYVQLRFARSGSNYSCSYSVFGANIPSTFNAIEFQVYYSNNTHNAWLYAYCSYGDYFGISIQILSATKWNGVSQMDKFVGYLGTAQSESSTGITKITPTRYATPYFGGSAVGSVSTPVYVDSDGQIKACIPSIRLGNTSISVVYQTIAKVGPFATNNFRNITLEFGPMTEWQTNSPVGKWIVELKCYGTNISLSACSINLKGTTPSKVKFFYYVDGNYVYLVVWRYNFTTGCIVRPIAYDGAELAITYEGSSAPSGVTLTEGVYTHVAMQ